jgi:hypothetical protein
MRNNDIYTHCYSCFTPSHSLYHKEPSLTAESTSVRNEASRAAPIQLSQDPRTFSILGDSLLVDRSIRGGVRCSGTTVVISGAISIGVVVRAICSQVRPIPQSFNASKQTFIGVMVTWTSRLDTIVPSVALCSSQVMSCGMVNLHTWLFVPREVIS